MVPHIDARAASQMAASILDESEVTAQRIRSGFANQNWRVTAGSRAFVLKIGPAQSAPKWQAATHGLRLARAAGLPVAKLHFSEVRNGNCVRLFDWIDGVPASELAGREPEQHRLGEQLGRGMRVLHGTELEFFGSRLDRSAPTFRTWAEYVTSKLEQINYRAVVHGVGHAALLLEATLMVEAWLPEISTQCQSVVCHRDLHADNLIVDEVGSLVGIIDWDMPEAWDAAGEWFKLDSFLFEMLPAARVEFEAAYFCGAHTNPGWTERVWLVHTIESMNVVANAPQQRREFTAWGLGRLEQLVVGPIG